jgi:CubicO group peptidase (beta-lactamase class C family)
MRATITVRHLLTQTAGYGWDESGPILSSFLLGSDPVRLVAELPMAAPPGTTFNYSTGNTHLLAAALTRAVRTPLAKFATDVLLSPSGIPLAGWDVDGAGNPLGGSEMYFTARALARFGQLYLDRGSAGGRQVVPAAWIDASWEQRSEVASPIYASMIPGLTGYGYLWWLRKSNERIMNSALGYGGQFILVVPELQLVIAGASALDGRNPGLIPQFKGIFGLVDQIVGSVKP